MGGSVSEAAGAGQDRAPVFMVVGPAGVLSVAHDEREAYARAETSRGVVVQLPVVADFRSEPMRALAARSERAWKGSV